MSNVFSFVFTKSMCTLLFIVVGTILFTINIMLFYGIK